MQPHKKNPLIIHHKQVRIRLNLNLIKQKGRRLREMTTKHYTILIKITRARI
jgi:hypothetical protein